MLDALFGNKTAARVLLYLQNYEEGYAREIAATFELPPTAVQNQLRKLEAAGILVSRLIGRTRLFTWNPRYPLLKQLRLLLAEALKYSTDKQIKAYFRKRKRPRRAGKPLWPQSKSANP
jgi:DNA-binding transcriptional ArsR family regulator